MQLRAVSSLRGQDAATIFIVRCITSTLTQLNSIIIVDHRTDHRNHVQQIECSRLQEHVRGILPLALSRSIFSFFAATEMKLASVGRPRY